MVGATGLGLEQDIELLRGLELFEGFGIEQLRLLAFGAHRRELYPGDVLYRENEVADVGFIVISGQIDLVREADSDVIVLESFGPGSLIGELALITETRRNANAVAVERCELLRITRTLFRRVLEEFPDLAEGLHRKMAANINELIEKLDGASAPLQQRKL